MAKYHLKSDGSPAVCTASIRACPVGGEDSHYDSEAAARQAYETSMRKSMVAVPARKVKMSLMDRLKGRSEAEVYEQKLEERYLDIWANKGGVFAGQGELLQAFKGAKHYKVRREEVLALVDHALAAQGKVKSIEDAARTLISENPRAFRNGLLGTSGYLDPSKHHNGAIWALEPGDDKAVHEQLHPMMEKLVQDRLALKKDLEEINVEAKMLASQIQQEGNMGADARLALSVRAKELYEKATSADPNIPALEQVQDRRAWVQAREDAVEELTERGVL